LHLPPLYKIKLREAQKPHGAQGIEAEIPQELERIARFFDEQRQKMRQESSKKVNAGTLSRTPAFRTFLVESRIG
jgi:hypothetical protein